MKPVELTERQWRAIHTDILKTYPASVALIRERMKAVLGFTDRTHRELIHNEADRNTDRNEWRSLFYKTSVKLDFYDERKRTMFLLKYSEIINDNV